MEVTPRQDAETEDSGCLTGSFHNSKIPFESTPNATPTTSLDPSRKRKAAPPALADTSGGCPAPPQFSSTLNESLLDNLERCKITPNYYVERSELAFEEKPPKYAKLNGRPTPATPGKERPQGAYYNESPYKEAIEILYPTKPVIPARKALTPQKGSGAKRIFSPAKKRLFQPARVDPMKYFSGNSIVLAKIFGYLSDGDLFRLSMVSKGWNGALCGDTRAYNRYKDFVEKHRVNKENYSITPPDSPPSPESPPVSPGRQQFHAYTKLAKKLSQGQSLTKCPSCSRPTVLEKNIGQCQSLTCGYIYCSLCLSFSTTGAADFHDRCRRSHLLVEKPRRCSRAGLSDLSNSGLELAEHATFFTETPSHSSRGDTSGYVSEAESPLQRVRRNLCGRAAVLSENNRGAPAVQRKRRRSSLVPVVSNEVQEAAEAAEPPSPPKVAVGSRQSRRNLKRLLR